MAARDPAGNVRQLRLLDAIRRLLRRDALDSLQRLLSRIRAEDIAALAAHLSFPERQDLLRALLPDRRRAAEVVSQLGPAIAAPLLAALDRHEAARLLEEMRADDSADLLAPLPEEVAQEILQQMRPADKQDVQELMQYRPTTAGGIMSTDFLAIDQEKTAAEAISILQQTPDAEMVFYVYCVNESGRLTGVLSLRDLLRVPPDTPLSKVMNPDVISVRPDVHQEEVARIVERYDLLAVPVVDEYGRLVGIVIVDDVIDVLREEATEDIMKMAGASAGEESPSGARFWPSLKGRLPWLGAGLAAGLIGAGVLASWLGRPESAVLVLAFLPVVLGVAGSIGTQSATVVMRGLAVGAADVHGPGRLVAREVRLGVPLALLAGAVAGFAGYTLGRGSLRLGVVVGAGLAVATLVSLALGALAPVVMRRVDVDPATTTGPAMATLLHLVALLIYLTLATAVLGGGAG